MASPHASTTDAATPQMTSQTLGPVDCLSSRHNSVSSESSGTSGTNAKDAAQSIVLAKPPVSSSTNRLTYQPTSCYCNDPLSRDYPKPTGEVNLDEMLARKPTKWSLAHYIKQRPIREPPNPMNAEQGVVQDLAIKKRELLEAKEQIQRLNIPK